jgi:hypothetical protein
MADRDDACIRHGAGEDQRDASLDVYPAAGLRLGCRDGGRVGRLGAGFAYGNSSWEDARGGGAGVDSRERGPF